MAPLERKKNTGQIPMYVPDNAVYEKEKVIKL